MVIALIATGAIVNTATATASVDVDDTISSALSGTISDAEDAEAHATSQRQDTGDVDAVRGQIIDEVDQHVDEAVDQQVERTVEDTVDERISDRPDHAQEIKDWVQDEYGEPVKQHPDIKEQLDHLEHNKIGHDAARQEIQDVVKQRNQDMLDDLLQHVDDRKSQQRDELKEMLEEKLPDDQYDHVAERLDTVESRAIGHDELDAVLDKRDDQIINKALERAQKKGLSDEQRTHVESKIKEHVPADRYDELEERLDKISKNTGPSKKWMEQQHQDILDDAQAYTDQQHEQHRNEITKEHDQIRNELEDALKDHVDRKTYKKLEDRIDALEQKDDTPDKKQLKQSLKKWLKTEVPEDRYDDLEQQIDALDDRLSALEDSDSQGINETTLEDWMDEREANILNEATDYTDAKTQQQEENRQEINELWDHVDSIYNTIVDVDDFKQWIADKQAQTLQESKAYTDQQNNELKDWVTEQLSDHNGTAGDVPKHSHPEYAPKDHEHPEYVTHDELDAATDQVVIDQNQTLEMDTDAVIAHLEQYVDSQISSIQAGISASQLRTELEAFRDWADNRFATQEDARTLAEQNEQLHREVAYLQEAMNQTEADTDTMAQVMADHNLTEFHYGNTQCNVHEGWNGDRTVQCVR